MRKKIIAGNWKMNIKPSETAALVKGVVEATKDFTNVEVVCCTPAIDVPAAVAAAAGTHVGVGAENCHWKESGAYTGEISTGMLLDAGAKYVHHRPQRAPPVLRRDGRDGQPARQGRYRGWPHGHRLRRRDA